MIFDCKNCDKVCKSRSALKQHNKYHVDPKERPYLCTKCDKGAYLFSEAIEIRLIISSSSPGFMLKSRLENHLIYAHEKPTKCTLCGKVVSNMDNHCKVIHPRPDQLRKCSICKKEMSAISLRNHVYKVHSGKKFPCPKCKKKFKTKSHLEAHEEQIHSGVRFKCEICSGFYRSRKSLNAHIKNLHPVEYAKLKGKGKGQDDLVVASS